MRVFFLLSFFFFPGFFFPAAFVFGVVFLTRAAFALVFFFRAFFFALMRAVYHLSHLPCGTFASSGEVCQSDFFWVFYAETLEAIGRRKGFAPGIGNVMCQKFASG